MIISFEGVNGCGKTSLLAGLAPLLPSGTKVIRSPGGTSEGEQIRTKVKAALAGKVSIDPHELARLNVRGFELSMKELISPALESNQLVLLDRWFDSTYAYQGAQGVSDKYIGELLDQIDCVVPDVTILLDVPVEIAQSRHTPDESMAPLEITYKRKVQGIYLARAANSPRTRIVDGTAAKDYVLGQVVTLLQKIGVETVQEVSFASSIRHPDLILA